MAYEKQLSELKKLTTMEKDFSVPTKYFIDHIAEDSAIGKHSKPLKGNKDFYKALLEPVMQNYYHGTAQIAGSYLMEIKDQHFVHGAISLSNGSLVALYFFTDIQLGMATIPTLGRMNYFRLNAFKDEREQGKASITPMAALRTMQ